MIKKITNSTHVEGYLYESKLERKVTGETAKNPNTEYINGTLSVATDDELLNVVSVHFSYVAEYTSKGKPNATYNILSNIVDGKIGTVMADGKENAGKVRIDSSINLNEWYDNRTPGCPLVSVKRNEGGFVHTTQELCDPKARATFHTDMIITGISRMDADPDRELPERGILRGFILGYKNALLPVEYTVLSSQAIDYFESLEATQRNPVFTRVQGKQVSKTIIKRIEEESAFGEAIVKEVRNSQRDFVVDWAQSSPYGWDTEDSILATEYAEMLANREIYLAEIKQRQDEYQANKNNAITQIASSKGEYKF